MSLRPQLRRACVCDLDCRRFRGPNSSPSALQSPPSDHEVALESTGGAQTIARILEAHVGRIVVVNPEAAEITKRRLAKLDLRAEWARR